MSKKPNHVPAKPAEIEAPLEEIIAAEIPVIEPAPCCGKDECEDCPLEAPQEAAEAPQEAPKPAVGPKTYLAQDGDSYASIAAAHLPAGQTKHAYATHLFSVNGGKSISAGTKVTL